MRQEPNSSTIDDRTMDEFNLNNLISDRLLEDHNGDESEKLMMALALQELVNNEKSKEEVLFPRFQNSAEKDFRSIVSLVYKNA